MSANIEELRKRVEQYLHDTNSIFDHIGLSVAYGDLWAFYVYKPSLANSCSGVPTFVLLNESTSPRLSTAEEAYPLMELAWP